METHRRTLVKAVVWQVLGLLTMALVGFYLTGSATLGSIIALVNTSIGFAVYFLYERVWARISWGRKHG
ncbi:DUF2061 domain-containing protein [Roseovarius sp. C7]|uniref:DUF2061 domain-containing protein n=1 Tax=Roseovarius sp. C7 TaxID=3398643 RepID=UPI0039F6E15B